MQITIETITPADAAALLDRNPGNRKIVAAHVRRYAADITAGKWQINGEAVKIDTEGNLIDGQHRLSAVVEAGVPIVTAVARGLPATVRLTMDQGKKRTMADQFKLRDISYPSVAACAAGHLWRWERGNPWGARNNYTASVSELLATRDRWPEIAEAASLGKMTSRGFCCGVGAGTWAGAYAVCLALDPDKARSFAEQCRTGAGLLAGSPVLALRSALIGFRASGRTLTRSHTINWIVLAFFDSIDGRNRRQFRRNHKVAHMRAAESRRIVHPEPTEEP